MYWPFDISLQGVKKQALILTLCNNNHDLTLRAYFQKGEHSKEVIKPYDWTYTTDYKGTLLGESLKLKVNLIFCFCGH